MSIYKEFSINNQKGPSGYIVPIIIMVIFFVSLFFLAKGIFYLLSWLAPALLIGAAILDYTVIKDYVKYIARIFKNNWVMGLVGVLLTIVGFPIVSGFLFFRAYVRKKLKSQNLPKENDFIDYEDLASDEDLKEEDFLILPQVESPPQAKKTTDKYDNLFE